MLNFDLTAIEKNNLWQFRNAERIDAAAAVTIRCTPPNSIINKTNAPLITASKGVKMKLYKRNAVEGK